MNAEPVSASAQRKDDHVRLAVEQAGNRQQRNDFDDVRFIHHALRATGVDEVTLQRNVLGAEWASPLYINAMTGGSEATGKINASLARVAHATGTPIASGSMSAMLKDPDTADTFTVLRKENPDGFIFANISANASVDEAQKVIEHIDANALQIHINAAQEIVMPEGDRSFAHWSDHIYAITQSVDVPVVVKEVGFGMSQETVSDLHALGVTAVDVSGRGGTNFATIENARRGTQDFDELADWGQSTVVSLLDVRVKAKERDIHVFASGGVRHPLDVAKALALGAQGVGVAGRFLTLLQQEGEAALISEIERWNRKLTHLLALMGAGHPEALQHTGILLSGHVHEFAQLRGIDASQYARSGSLALRRTHAK